MFFLSKLFVQLVFQHHHGMGSCGIHGSLCRMRALNWSHQLLRDFSRTLLIFVFRYVEAITLRNGHRQSDSSNCEMPTFDDGGNWLRTSLVDLCKHFFFKFCKLCLIRTSAARGPASVSASFYERTPAGPRKHGHPPNEAGPIAEPIFYYEKLARVQYVV